LIGVPYYFQETKTYKALYQMTKQTTTGVGGTAADIEYNFAATTNNGRISSRKNNVSGEEVVYAYDELNRLISASTAGTGGWGQSFSYDGFGNLLNQTPTKGTAPSVLLSVDGGTNRVNSSGWSYDANGNVTLMPIVGGSTVNTFDVDNRMISSLAGTEQYGYAPDNKRVWKKAPDGTETVYFYGANGQKLVTYTVQASPFALVGARVNVYFGGKLIRADGVAVVHDRLGSVVARVTCAACVTPGVVKKDYFPYGDEIGGATAGNGRIRSRKNTVSREERVHTHLRWCRLKS
jgi:YD repeat-containing protein